MSGRGRSDDDLVAELFRSAGQRSRPDDLFPEPAPPPDPAAADPRGQSSGDEPPGRTVRVVPTLAERFDGTQGTVAALSMRIESLASALNAVRSTFAGQLGEYADTLSRVHRTQVETVDEYRHGIERSLAELRVFFAGHAEASRLIAHSLDSSAANTVTALDVLEHLSSESKALRSVSESSTRQLATTLADLDRWLIDRFQDLDKALLERFERLDRVESSLSTGVGEAVSALSSLRMVVDECRVDLDNLLHALRNGGDSPLTGELESLREEIHALKRRIGLRAKPDPLRDEDVERIASALIDHIERRFDLVADGGAAPSRSAARRARSAPPRP